MASAGVGGSPPRDAQLIHMMEPSPLPHEQKKKKKQKAAGM